MNDRRREPRYGLGSRRDLQHSLRDISVLACGSGLHNYSAEEEEGVRGSGRGARRRAGCAAAGGVRG